jgi:hypothetical protein
MSEPFGGPQIAEVARLVFRHPAEKDDVKRSSWSLPRASSINLTVPPIMSNDDIKAGYRPASDES